MDMKIQNFKEFCDALIESGFSMGGGNDKGIFAVIPYSWEEQQFIDTAVKWHTGNPETDPWEWRMRVLEERSDIAYSKLFFHTSGYITKQWYPYFLAVRRNGETFEEAYQRGTVSQTAKRIYEIISENGRVPFHEIKSIGMFKREDNSKFERSVVELQMRMFITMCGREQKKNKFGEGYGWNSTVFCTVEQFWRDDEVFCKADSLSPEEAEKAIIEQIYKLNPNADIKKIKKFVRI